MLTRAAQTRCRLPGRWLNNPALRQVKLHIPRSLVSSQPSRSLASSSLSQKLTTPSSKRVVSHDRLVNGHVTRSLTTVQSTLRSDPPVFTSSPSPTQSALTARRSELRPFDASDLIVLHNTAVVPDVYLNKQNGIGGNSTELHQNLHACLSVGRYERAAAIVRRLANMFMPDAAELVEAHNVYLRSLANAVVAGKVDTHSAMRKMRYWFETQMVNKDVAINGTTMANMCRGAMAALPYDAQLRTIRRYLHQSEQLGLLEDTLSSSELTEDEWESLLRLRHELFPVEAISRSTDPIILESKQIEQDDLPSEWLQVKPVPQKGAGLTSIQKSLTSIKNIDSVPYPHDLEGSQEEKDRAWAKMRQIRLEEDVVDVAMKRWKDEYDNMLKMGVTCVMSSHSMEALLWQWQIAMEKAIAAELSVVNQALHADGIQDSSRAEYGPYLEAAQPDKMAAITILMCTQAIIRQRGEGVPLAAVASKIGAQIEKEVAGAGNGLSLNRRADRESDQKKRRAMLGLIDRPSIVKQEDTIAPSGKREQWPKHVQIQIGALLLAKLIDSAVVPIRHEERGTEALEPAFRHTIEHLKGKRIGMLRAQHTLIEKLNKEPQRTTVGLSGHMPMLVEPRPWEDLNKGGYFRYSPQFIRQAEVDDVQIMYGKAAAEKGDLAQIFSGLDVLGRTPWRVNNKVLQVMLDAWNSGQEVADLPAEKPQKDFPMEPAKTADPAKRRKWRQTVQKIENEISGLHSQRCYLNLQLEIACAFADKVFYYPHNIDFRGRAYPVPPILNHMGADSARGLLMFGHAKPLGTTGVKWLKIHLSNLFGFDKASLEEREQFSMDHMDDIKDSVANPLGGRRWWLKAEDPWQCLAACFELKAALDSPDPAKFLSHIPVAQDGSCNGLQHYAALGGDTFGATQVNLEPGNRPADVYSGVAALVKESIEKDAADNNQMALMLNGKITRKVVKQTVMTNVYGVTFAGARAQVQRQLDDIMEDLSEGNVSNYTLAAYIAKKIFKALATMFGGAHDIQYWFAECADRITRAITPEQIQSFIDQKSGKVDTQSRTKFKDATWNYWAKKNAMNGQVKAVDFRTSVIWTTPLKLPVVQPYRAPKARDVETSLQHIRFKEPRPYDPVHRRRQIQAFPPNFVHSLDATHMLLSALKCEEAGLTFAAVHDSFWTHAGDVPVMSRLLRKAFIEMHSDDIIGRLASEFNARYKGSLQLAHVYESSPLGQKILALRYTQATTGQRIRETWKGKTLSSRATQKELLEEWERQQLLQSADPEDRIRGKEMVTAGSLYEAASHPDDFLPSSTDLSASQGASATQLLDQCDEGTLEEEDAFAIQGEELGFSVLSKIAKRMNKKTAEPKLVVWAPLIFPTVPEKGAYDVQRLKDSDYFFS